MSEPTDTDQQWYQQLARDLHVSGGVEFAFGDVTLTVASSEWVSTLQTLRDGHSFTYFDWLSAIDEGSDGFWVFCHLYDPSRHRRLLVRVQLDQQEPRLDSLTPVFRGAAWHERETAEMFGIAFVGHPRLTRLLLTDEFEGHPLRKDFVLTARVSKVWPGAKEPGESGDGAPSRRKMQPPGVPDPGWGPTPLTTPSGADDG
jgi:NADH-quinone oxidoreductase subunit C